MKVGKSRTGFTVVELLVAVAITTVIASVMLTVTGGTLNLWRRAQDNFTSETEAQLIFDYLTRDLQGALLRSDGHTWLACNAFDSTLANHGWIVTSPMKPAVTQYVPGGSTPNIAEARFGRSGIWLRMITTTGGLPTAVGYQVVRRSLTGASTVDPDSIRYSLYRVAVTSDATFAAGYNIYGHDSALIAPSSTYNVGTNVVDFGVWFYRRESSGALTRIFPATASDTTFASANANEFPAYADVMIRVLTDEGAATILAMERGFVVPPANFVGGVDAWWWSVIEKHSRVYTRRVEIRGVGL
jgi:hypothetical protein